jgi:hypothetical protein
MGFDFSLSKLKKFYQSILQQDYTIVTFAEHVCDNINCKVVILRHDVDKMLKNSLKVAVMEHSLGIKSTYYFRYKKDTFDPQTIKKIANLGHEIGYHYEVLSKTKGDPQKGIKLFEKELKDFRKYVDVKTICMHGSPLSKWDSRKLWSKYNYQDFGVMGEPYFDIDYNRVAYFTDTGRRWDGENVNIRDKVSSVKKYNYRTTDDIIAAFNGDNFPDNIMINIHPQRWNDSYLLWTKELIGQNLKNIIKRCIVRFRR